MAASEEHEAAVLTKHVRGAMLDRMYQSLGQCLDEERL